MAFGGDDSSSSDIHSSLRPLTPPAALTSSNAIVAPARLPVPKIAAGPVRLPRMPILISLSVTPTSAAWLAESPKRERGAETITAKATENVLCFRRRRQARRLGIVNFPSRKSERTLDYWKD